MKKLSSILIALLLLCSLVPAMAFADAIPSVSLAVSGNTMVNNNDTIYLSVKSQSDSAEGYKLVVTPQDDSLSVNSGSSGIIKSTESVSTVYMVKCSSKATVGAHKILVQAVLASDEKTVLQEKSFTVTVLSSGSNNSNMAIAQGDVTYSLSEGDSLVAGAVNYLTVSVYNREDVAIKSASLSLSLPAGISIQSGAAAIYVGNIVPQQVVSATFPIVCSENISAGSYEVGVNCKGYVISTEVISNYDEEGQIDFYTARSEAEAGGFSTSFYLPVTVAEKEEKKEETTTDAGIANPILLLSEYSCGGSVLAGEDFGLTLKFVNTSDVLLRNIKVTIDSQDGSFIPAGSSSSFYIKEVKAGESASYTVQMSCMRTTEQGPHSIAVSSSYETEKQAVYTANDTISVPVTQQIRLVVDDILDPGYLTADSQGYLSVDFRNMGNSQISNLVITLEGDFTTSEGSSYIGNLQSGKSDSYSASFMPLGAGDCNGKVIFTYEDAEGNELKTEKAFCFNIGEAYNWDEPTDDPIYDDPTTGFPSWAYYAIGAAVIAGIVVVIVISKKKKAKKMEALDLDE